MVVRIVIDADWFVVNGRKYIKQLSYCVVGNGLHGTYTFTLPVWIRKHSALLELQARLTHGLPWNTIGNYFHSDLRSAVQAMEQKVGSPLLGLHLFSKGGEKCQLLGTYFGPVTNLEELGCPKYGKLTCIPQTTVNKAITFALWLDTDV